MSDVLKIRKTDATASFFSLIFPRILKLRVEILLCNRINLKEDLTMFREIRTMEKITDSVEKKELNYKKIKPEEKMTIEEADVFWTEMFNQMAREVE